MSRKKDKELRSYYFVRRVIDGDEAAKAILEFRQMSAYGCVTGSGVYVSLMTLLAVLATRDKLSLDATSLRLLIAMIGAVGTLVSFAGAVTFIRVWRIVTRLRNFSSYEASIIEKWGEPERQPSDLVPPSQLKPARPWPWR